MKKRLVQYGEQADTNEETTTMPGVSAPMVERAFRVLNILSVSEEGSTLSDLARTLGMSKGSMHGLLKTLESNGVIEQADERRYVLGSRIYDLAQTYTQRAGLRHFALPAMQRLSSLVNKTVFLGKVESRGVRIIECVADEGEHPALRISAPRGTRVHLLAGALGRVLLASWPVAQREAFLHTHPLPHFTEHSIVDSKLFLAEVEQAARSGVSIDREEYLVGVNAVASPIYGTGERLVALLWIVGFSSFFAEEELQRTARLLRAEAEAISHSLGAR
jgi:DNA-binding IclR family transcriptional regulator